MRSNQLSYDARPARTAADARSIGVPVTVLGRLAGAGLLVGMAWIHWHLYYLGFSAIHLIGPAFYANAVLGVFAAAAVLLTPRRWLGLVAGAAALLDAGTLAALVLSLTVGLFGYHELTSAPLIPATAIVEGLGTIVLAWLAVTQAPVRGWLRALAARRRS